MSEGCQLVQLLKREKKKEQQLCQNGKTNTVRYTADVQTLALMNTAIDWQLILNRCP